MAAIIIQSICCRLGGAVSVEKLPKFEFESALAELKIQQSSNVVPIGLV